MEHSALHAFELIGQIIALGGIFLLWGILRPAERTLKTPWCRAGPYRELQPGIERWISRGCLMAALATFINLFVEVAEVQGKTIFAGVNLDLFARFSTGTTVGRLEVARIAVPLLGAVLALIPSKVNQSDRPSSNQLLVERLTGALKWSLIFVCLVASLFLTSMVSHSAAQPVHRIEKIAAQILHILAVAAWMGVLMQLLVARSWIEEQANQQHIGLVAAIVRRFSPIALTFTSLLFLSGLFMTLHLLGSGGALFTSAYGLILVVKMTLLAPAVATGWVNFRFIRPRLNQFENLDRDDVIPVEQKRFLLHRFCRMLELETTAGLLVIFVAGILASVSPPGESGIYRLTHAQTQALLVPRIPSAHYIDPATFYGAPERTTADLLYAEFTHHWSGAMVLLLGLFWLLQSLGGRTGKWAGYGWPLLLVPFSVLVTVASDPEIWMLRRVSSWQVLQDPQLFEHKVGGLILFVLVWLGWRDRRAPQAGRPLGYAMPVICILGGALLLGHVHSMVNANETVTNLISLEHVIFGAFMIFAGFIRWLSLRGLFPRRPADVLWPAMICGLGIFMTFFYRELV